MSTYRLLSALAGAALLAASAPASAGGKVYAVTLHNMAFGPTPASLRVGDVIEWVNADIFRHSATARDRSFDVDLPPKARVRTVVNSAGTISFYCRYHPGMTGKLAVGR
jgi:plastocyanin